MKNKANRHFEIGTRYCWRRGVIRHRIRHNKTKYHYARGLLLSPYYVDKRYGTKNAWRNCKRAHHYFLRHPRELYKNINSRCFLGGVNYD